jgi:hypothetical protein
MLKTLWTVTAAGLLALCMTGCGGGSDYASKICDKMKSCDSTTDVSACKTTANQYLSAIPSAQKNTADTMLDNCLAQTSCTIFMTCIDNAKSLLGGSGTSSTY